MYHGVYDNQRQRRCHRRRNQKSIALLVAMVMVLGAFVGATVAYLFTSADSIVNTFTPASVTTEITEDFDKEVKNNVQVKNTGDISAYIRAEVVVTWQNEKGEIAPTVPVMGTDYNVTFPNGTGWVEHKGFYYYTSAVASQASTGVLLTACQPVEGKAPAGYHLSVEILASAIQSEPQEAVQEAWNVTIKDGKVEAYTVNGGGVG